MPLNDLLKPIKDSYDIFYKLGPRVGYILSDAVRSVLLLLRDSR